MASLRRRLDRSVGGRGVDVCPQPGDGDRVQRTPNGGRASVTARLSTAAVLVLGSVVLGVGSAVPAEAAIVPIPGPAMALLDGGDTDNSNKGPGGGGSGGSGGSDDEPDEEETDEPDDVDTDEPDEPDEPDQPDEPDEPDLPDEPDQPDLPDDPANDPDDGEPVQPENPGPVTPDEPTGTDPDPVGPIAPPTQTPDQNAGETPAKPDKGPVKSDKGPAQTPDQQPDTKSDDEPASTSGNGPRGQSGGGGSSTLPPTGPSSSGAAQDAASPRCANPGPPQCATAAVVDRPQEPVEIAGVPLVPRRSPAVGNAAAGSVTAGDPEPETSGGDQAQPERAQAPDEAQQNASALSGPADSSLDESGLSTTFLLVLLLGASTVSAVVGLVALWWRVRTADA